MGRKDSLDCFIITAPAVMEPMGMVGEHGAPSGPSRGPGHLDLAALLSSNLSGLQAASSHSQGDPGLGHTGAQLPHGSQQDQGPGPLLSWRAWGRAQAGQSGPFSENLGVPGVSLPSHPQGGQVLKKVGGGGWGHWVPTEMDPLGQGRSSGALLMESALGLQRPAAEPGDTGPLDLKQGPQMANHLSGGQFSFLMMSEGSPFLPSPLSSLFPSYPSPLISRSPILGSLAAGWLHKAAWPSRAGRGVCPSMLGQQGAH